MQTTISLPEIQLKQLRDLATDKKISESHLIQQIISKWLEQQPKVEVNQNIRKGFGLWQDNADVVDGLSYQKQLRSEW